jgi:RimJ/RimL family protein N-acetyltransferase
MIDVKRQDLHRAYLQKRLDYILQPDAQFIATTDPYGVAGFERYNGSDIEVHYGGERGFLRKSFLRACARYVFLQLGCDRITGRIPANRPQAIRLGERLGFRHEGTLRRAHQGTDILIFGMLKEECRWL